MAISTNSPDKTTEPASDNPNPSKSDLQPSSAAPPSTVPATTANLPVNPNPILNNPQPPQQVQSFIPPTQVSSVHPSFRPATLPVPIPSAPQFSPLPNPSFQNHGIQGQVQVQPPGVMQQPPQMMQYGQPGQQPMRMYAPMPNGYQMAVPQGTMNPPVSY